jgi:hypothetical protein
MSAYYYQVIRSLLASKEDVVVFMVLTNSSEIFSLALPGVYVLVPSYISCIKLLVIILDISL